MNAPPFAKLARSMLAYRLACASTEESAPRAGALAQASTKTVSTALGPDGCPGRAQVASSFSIEQQPA